MIICTYLLHDNVKFYYVSLPGQSFKSILFDVDSKDSTVGMSCPPVQFLEQEVLDTVKSCIRDNGNNEILNLILTFPF